MSNFCRVLPAATGDPPTGLMVRLLLLPVSWQSKVVKNLRQTRKTLELN